MKWLAFLLISPVMWGCSPKSGYSFCRTLTVDHTKVGTVNNTDQSNFPFPVVYTKADWAVVGSGGAIQHTVSQSGGDAITVPADFVFTSDAAGTTLLNWEFEAYTTTTGAVTAWVMLASVSHTVDTLLYVSYGNASVSTFQGNVNSTWSSVYLAVYHLSFFDASTPKIEQNSVSGSHAVTSSLGTLVSGVIGSALSGATNARNGTNSSTGFPTGSSPRTLEMWLNTGNVAFTSSHTSPGGWGTFSTLNMWSFDAVKPSAVNDLNVDTFNDNCSFAGFTIDSNWHYLVAVLPSGSTTVAGILLYIDGVLVSTSCTGGSGTVNTTLGATTADITIGNAPGTLNTNPVASTSSIDEWRATTDGRTADWVKTTYNSINSPTTFVTISAATGATTPPPFGIINQ